MQDINHPDLFWPALDRLIAGAPSTSRVAHEVSRFLDREDAFKSLIEGSFRDEPDAAEWRKLCQKARAMARRKLAHPAPYAARLLKSGTVQFRPTSRSRLSTNPPRHGHSDQWRFHGSICRSAMPNSTFIERHVWIAASL